MSNSNEYINVYEYSSNQMMQCVSDDDVGTFTVGILTTHSSSKCESVKK